MMEPWTNTNFWIAVAAVTGVIITLFELDKAIKISRSNAETTLIVEFNKWNVKCRRKADFTNLLGMLNVLELMIRYVKRGLYPFNEYKCTFFPVTFEYIHALEMEYYRVFQKTSDDFRKDFERYAGSLLPIFDLYIDKSNKFLNGGERTPHNLKGFLYSEDRELSESDFKKLKYKLKYPRLYAIRF